MTQSHETATHPSADDIRKLVATQLSSRARITYTLLLLADLVMGAIITSLWLTEADLPVRTRVAFALMVLVSAGWAVFFAWTLTRRTLFLPSHRLVSARIAVAATSVFAGGALLLAIVDTEVRATALSAAALGGVMLAVAIAMLIAARRRLRVLLERRKQLTGELGRAASLVMVMLLLLGSHSASAQVLSSMPFELRVDARPVVAKALGRQHLVYELHVTNFGAVTQNLISLAAIDTADGRVLGNWEGAQLAQRIASIGSAANAGAERTNVGPGERAVIYVWLTLRENASVPGALRHRLVAQQDGTGPKHELLGGSVAVSASAAALAASPVSAGRWLAVRGPSNASGHRRSLVALDGSVSVPQRFAVDWARLGDDGKLFRGTGAANEEWFSYGTPVISAVAGRVVAIVDGIADNEPRNPKMTMPLDRANVAGNSVVIDAGDGRFAFYAHLRAGSIKIATGDLVRAGQVIGRIGNSGQSLAPHLHFHLTDGRDPMASEGLPFVLSSFRLAGRIDSVPRALAGDAWHATPDRPSRDVVDEMPLENMVIELSASSANAGRD